MQPRTHDASRTITQLLLAGCLFMTRTSVRADIISGPDIIPAPQMVTDEAAVNDGQQGFNEAQGVVLEDDVETDDGVTIAAGTRVNSHMIFLNPAGADVLDDFATWTFDGAILGVISDRDGDLLAATEDRLGAPDTIYPGAFAFRGLEGPGDVEAYKVDWYEIPGPTTLEVEMNSEYVGDWIRVITEDCQCERNVFINEIRVKHPAPGGPAYQQNEYFELRGEPLEPLDDLYYVVLEASGHVDEYVDLSGHTLDARGYFLCGPADPLPYFGTSVDIIDSLYFDDTGNRTHLLVCAPDGLGISDEGVSLPTPVPWCDVLDSVALADDPAAPYWPADAVVGPNSAGNTPPHVYRCRRTAEALHGLYGPGGPHVGEWRIGRYFLVSGDDTPDDHNPWCFLAATLELGPLAIEHMPLEGTMLELLGDTDGDGEADGLEVVSTGDTDLFGVLIDGPHGDSFMLELEEMGGQDEDDAIEFRSRMSGANAESTVSVRAHDDGGEIEITFETSGPLFGGTGGSYRVEVYLDGHLQAQSETPFALLADFTSWPAAFAQFTDHCDLRMPSTVVELADSGPMPGDLIRFVMLDAGQNLSIDDVLVIGDGIDDFVITNESYPEPWPDLCPADVNGDGAVDADDLIIVILAWGGCTGCDADVNNDGTVGVDDVIEIVLGWGMCPPL